MAWRAIGCLPAVILFLAIASFILYAIGAFNDGIVKLPSNVMSIVGKKHDTSIQNESTNNENDENQISYPKLSQEKEPLSEKPVAPRISGSMKPLSSIANTSNRKFAQAKQTNPEVANKLNNIMGSLGIKKKEPQKRISPRDLPSISGQIRIINGDTFEMNGKIIRLYAVDAPESNQSCADRKGRSYRCGQEAAKWLSEWIQDGIISCKIMQQNSKGYIIGPCAYGQYDIGAALVNVGWAVAYRKISRIYTPYEAQAKENYRGLWQGQFYMPWDWREMQKKKPKIKILKPKKIRRKSGLF
jgi:endonuclease YncB( thermonuclease family)